MHKLSSTDFCCTGRERDLNRGLLAWRELNGRHLNNEGIGISGEGFICPLPDSASISGPSRELQWYKLRT